MLSLVPTSISLFSVDAAENRRSTVSDDIVVVGATTDDSLLLLLLSLPNANRTVHDDS